jgi:hypothetical protein
MHIYQANLGGKSSTIEMKNLEERNGHYRNEESITDNVEIIPLQKMALEHAWSCSIANYSISFSRPLLASLLLFS